MANMGMPSMPSPLSAALLSGSIKARPGRKGMTAPKAPTGIKSAPGRKGLLPAKPPLGGLGGAAPC